MVYDHSMKIKNNKIINWLKDDWKNNRFRLFCETIGSLGFISIYVLMAWYGDSVSIELFLVSRLSAHPFIL